MTILISYFPFKCVHRGTEVLIASFNAIQDIMEKAVSRRVNVQWTCMILCLAVKLPAQQVSQYLSAFHFHFQTKYHLRRSYYDVFNISLLCLYVHI